jgi:hypothetical protein
MVHPALHRLIGNHDSAFRQLRRRESSG